jgi:hypothetical protein
MTPTELIAARSHYNYVANRLIVYAARLSDATQILSSPRIDSLSSPEPFVRSPDRLPSVILTMRATRIEE